MKQTCLILSANSFDITDEVTRKNNAGVTVSYIMSDSLAPYQESPTIRGFKPAKGSLPVEFDKELTKVPGIYECDFSLKTNANGKPELKLTSVKLKAEVKAA